MGSPLGPPLANNIFLGYHERRWLDNNCPPTFKPVLNRRYIDDTFCYLGMNLASKIS